MRPGILMILISVVSTSVCAQDGTSRPTDLSSILESIREKHKLPALAGAVVRGDQITAVGAVGVRRLGADEKVTANDRFHIGSCAKSFTATMIARLVEQGKLSWSTTVAQAFPNLVSSMKPVYREVTLEQLLLHRSGIPPFTRPDPKYEETLQRLPSDPPASRRAFVEFVLKLEPVATPGSKSLYSNAGYTVAAAMAEKAMAQSWESLIGEHIFKPLGMTSAGFGWASVQDRNQPWGHFFEGTLIPHAPDHPYKLPPYLAPGGDIHCNISDLARYAANHLQGLQGKDGILKAAAFERIHTPLRGAPEAMGWLRATRVGFPSSWHNGTAGTFFAWITIWPQFNTAIVVVTNAGNGEAACAETTAALFKPAAGIEGDARIAALVKDWFRRIQNGTFDRNKIVPDLAKFALENGPSFRSLGEPVVFHYRGTRSAAGSEVYAYRIVFPAAVLQWEIGFDSNGVVNWLLAKSE